MSAARKTTITMRVDGTWVEFLRTKGDPEGFLTVARGDDGGDDERVMILTPAQGAKLGRLLVEWALSQKAKP